MSLLTPATHLTCNGIGVHIIEGSTALRGLDYKDLCVGDMNPDNSNFYVVIFLFHPKINDEAAKIYAYKNFSEQTCIYYDVCKDVKGGYTYTDSYENNNGDNFICKCLFQNNQWSIEGK